jgi:hypothetical protein
MKQYLAFFDTCVRRSSAELVLYASWEDMQYKTFGSSSSYACLSRESVEMQDLHFLCCHRLLAFYIYDLSFRFFQVFFPPLSSFYPLIVAEIGEALCELHPDPISLSFKSKSGLARFQSARPALLKSHQRCVSTFGVVVVVSSLSRCPSLPSFFILSIDHGTSQSCLWSDHGQDYEISASNGTFYSFQTRSGIIRRGIDCPTTCRV